MLVVDDSPTVVGLLQAALEAAEFEVTTAGDGLEALALVATKRPDVIVTDSLMPRMDGYGLLKALRRDTETRGIPVIMLTAADPTDREREAPEERPDVVVVKSLRLDQVVAEVERLAARPSPPGRAVS